MKFTPFGIKNQEFNKTVRGYDKDEVKAFLEKLADEFERLQIDNDKLKTEIEKMEDQIQEFKKIEKNLQSAMISATESTSKAVDSAKKQTALMLKEAELKAAQIIEKAKENANSTRDAVLKLREEKKLLIARLRAMVDTQSNILEMNVENIPVQPKKVIKEKPAEKPDEAGDINVDDILEKLL